MKIRFQLLPYWCQIVGYSYWALYLLFCLALIAFPYDSSMADLFRRIHLPIIENWEIVGALNYAMLILAAFSREKVEDEMMMSLRMRAIVYVILFNFILHFISILSPATSVIGSFVSEIINDFMTDFGILVIMYLAIFKISVWLNRWRMRDEE